MKVLPSYLKIKDKLPLFLDIVKEYNKNVNENLKIDTIHVDVMDKKFVPYEGVDLEDIKYIKERGLKADVHLMCEKPLEDKYIDKAIEYGADAITVHVEIENLEKVLKYLYSKKIVVGLSINPNTDPEKLKEYICYINKVLVMSVEPGKGGQEFIYTTYDKVKKIKKINSILEITVDGGVNDTNAKKLLDASVDNIVCGSYITNDLVNIEENIKKII